MRGPDVLDAWRWTAKLDGGRRRSQAARMQRACKTLRWTTPAPLDTFRQRFRPLSITDSHGDPDPARSPRPPPRLHAVRTCPSTSPAELTVRALILGRAARARLRRLERVPRAQDRAHGLGLDSDRGALGGVLPDPGPLDDPGEQHRPDHRLRRRVHRGRHRVHPAGHPAHGLRPERRQGGDRGGGGRRDGHPADDPAPPRADREGARPAHLPRGHRLRRGAGRRARRAACRRGGCSRRSASPSSTSS